MDNLVLEMTGESIDYIGQLVVAKLNQKGPNERREAVNKIFDALYEPNYPKDVPLERLMAFICDMYSNFDADTKKFVTFQIQKLCMETRTKYEEPRNNNKHAETLANGACLNGPLSPIWLNKDKNIGKRVKILIGMHLGTIAEVERIEQNKYVHVKLVDGRIIKYLFKHVDFLD